MIWFCPSSLYHSGKYINRIHQFLLITWSWTCCFQVVMYNTINQHLSTIITLDHLNYNHWYFNVGLPPHAMSKRPVWMWQSQWPAWCSARPRAGRLRSSSGQLGTQMEIHGGFPFRKWCMMICRKKCVDGCVFIIYIYIYICICICVCVHRVYVWMWMWVYVGGCRVWIWKNVILISKDEWN